MIKKESSHKELIDQLVKRHLQSLVVEISKFETGLINDVYDVKLSDDRRIVARLAQNQNAEYLKDGLYWQTHLEKLGVRLPKVIASGETSDVTYAILERLPGQDIEVVYPHLAKEAKQTIAQELTQVQEKVALLDLSLFREEAQPWITIIERACSRSERDFGRLNLFPTGYVQVIREAFAKIEPELNRLPLIPFLYDTNLKNVIIHNGHISGIIDVDEMWLGDPLLAVGRGKTLSLLREWDLDLYDYWVDCLNLSVEEKFRTELYATLYCIRTMSILGRAYNGNVQIENDISNAKKIEAITRKQMASLGLKLV
ncbi:MAG: phosphotransferase family protein [Anaerolineae bacterium]